MRVRKALAALLVPAGFLAFTACGQQQGCFDEDGEQVSCNFDRDDEDDDEGFEFEDD